MSSSPEAFTPIEGSPFQRIVEQTEWKSPDIIERLRFAGSLGCLIVVDDVDPVGAQVPELLVGFSHQSVEEPVISPPANLDDVRRQLSKATIGWFNTDMTAKGLGVSVTNTPEALQPSGVTGEIIAVRGIHLGLGKQIHHRAERDAPLFQKLRLARHGALLAFATVIDQLRRDRGTYLAMRFMERGYGDADIVRMPAPPSWQSQQRAHGIMHDVPPQKILVRGGMTSHAYNEMNTIGTFPAAGRRKRTV